MKENINPNLSSSIIKGDNFWNFVPNNNQQVTTRRMDRTEEKKKQGLGFINKSKILQ
jgi:hypothetical protein